MLDIEHVLRDSGKVTLGIYIYQVKIHNVKIILKDGITMSVK